MSLQIDIKYLSLISSRLPKFTNKGNNLYNFRCPICKDSQKQKNKARGYCYSEKNNLYYKCHNCDVSTTFPKFLEQIDPQMYKEYIMERFKNGETGKSNYKKKDLNLEQFSPINKNKGRIKIPFDLKSIEDLEISHPAKRYLNGRLIPSHLFHTIFYTDDFKELVSKLDPDSDFKLTENEGRIIIPFYDKDKNLIAIQGRSLVNTGLRYITIKTDKTAPKIFGLDTVNFDIPFYVLEGPIDAMMLDNAIAAAGSDFPKNLNKENAILVYDNEGRKIQSVKKVQKAITNGYKVCIWPSHIKEKDVNEMVINGLCPAMIIQESTYQGIEAQVQFGKWKKI